MVHLQPDPFLNELSSMFERNGEKGSVWVNFKRSSLKSKVDRNKMNTKGETIEYRCLVRATDGKKKIATSLSAKDYLRFQASYTTILKARITSLKKRDRKEKRKATEITETELNNPRSAKTRVPFQQSGQLLLNLLSWNKEYKNRSTVILFISNRAYPLKKQSIVQTWGAVHSIDIANSQDTSPPAQDSIFSVHYLQKLIAELVATYFLLFAGNGVVIVNINSGKVVSFLGVAITWGLLVLVMIYATGHISGAHFNPVVTIGFASVKKFPWNHVPLYITVQVLASVLASGTLKLVFSGKQDQFTGTMPSGSELQSFVLEFIITFYLMFVIAAVATDNRAVGELAGLAIGSTVLLNILFTGLISGASMNPARTLGPAIVWNRYEHIWLYITGPILGAVCGAWVYNFIRFTKKSTR